MSLDLLSSPSGRLDRAWLEVTVALGVFDQGSDPVSAVVVGVVAIRKCVGEIPSQS